MKPYALLMILITIAACSHPKPEVTGLEGKALPSFCLLLNDSSTYLDTRDIPAGKSVVLFIFSPTCPFCRAEMNEILKNASIEKDIQFYAFTAWPFSYMKKFYKHYHIDAYPNITMGIDAHNLLGSYFKVKGVPYLAIYGKDKRLRRAYIGNLSYKDIESAAMD